jgi:hypothetical protein
VELTGVGSVLLPTCLTSTPGPALGAHVLPDLLGTVARQDAVVQRGVAWPGITLDLLPALTMVSAVVVRSMALVLGPLASCDSSSGPNSHRLDSATRCTTAHLRRRGLEHLARDTLERGGQLLAVEPPQRLGQLRDGAGARGPAAARNVRPGS